jgi:hypothetical protein
MSSADVIRELRAARPVADDALHARVRSIAARTPERRRGPLARFSGWRRGALIAVPTAAALAVATAGAIGLARSGDADRLARPAPVESATDLRQSAPESAPDSSKTAAPPAGSAAGSSTVGPTTDRAQRFSATLSLEVADTDELSEATQRALRIARDLGGFAANVSYASAETGMASMTLRIPTERVQDAITRLSQLGTIVGQQVQVDDLQEGLDELRAQQATLRARIARLTAQLRDPELAAVRRAALEAQRRTARGDLAEVSASARATVEQASLATIQLGLQTDEQRAVPAAPSRFDRALDQAVAVLAWEGIALLFAAIVAGPLLAAMAAAGVWRHVHRRGRDDLLASR